MIKLKNRFQAGQQLLPLLGAYQGQANAIVLGLARGGVVTAAAVAAGLHLHLNVVCPRKIGAPFNPELAIGAISDEGDLFLNEDMVKEFGISWDYIESQVTKEKKIAYQRLQKYRRNRPPPHFTGKTIILVDDGLATGATMKAAIKGLHSQKAARIVVAVPVSPPNTLEEIQAEVDEVICLDAPSFFTAVGQFYEDFSQTEDEEIIAYLKQFS